MTKTPRNTATRENRFKE